MDIPCRCSIAPIARLQPGVQFRGRLFTCRRPAVSVVVKQYGVKPITRPVNTNIWCKQTLGESSGEQQRRKLDSERYLQRLFEPKQIGSEYGQGFVQFQLCGDPIHLDVDTLNERLRVSGATRMRHAMKPDEAFGMIFSWDGVIMDVRYLQRTAWKRLASEQQFLFPLMERAVYDIRPERAITEVLQWTRDWSTAERLAHRFAELFSEEFEREREPLPGVREWLVALAKANVPCAVISRLDRMDVRRALDRMRLSHYFQAEVTAEDGMETTSQRFLSAAVKLGRPPNQCVVFDSCPESVTAAHNCTMKAVGIQSLHKGYQLKAADLTCSSMSELSVYNVRRLFANRGSEFMDLRQQTHGPACRNSRRITSALLDPPDNKI